MDRADWQATVQGVTNSQTQLSTYLYSGMETHRWKARLIAGPQ